MKRPGVRAALVVMGGLALAGALFVGVTDNPPGILLLYGALTCLILAAVCTWRRPRSFFLLFALSGVGFVVFAVLHNVFYAIGESVTVSWVKSLLEAFQVGSFLVAVLLCPAGLLVGLVGWLATTFRTRRESKLSAG